MSSILLGKFWIQSGAVKKRILEVSERLSHVFTFQEGLQGFREHSTGYESGTVRKGTGETKSSDRMDGPYENATPRHRDLMMIRRCLTGTERGNEI